MQSSSKIKISWYCGYYVGEPKWHGDAFEPDECGTTFTTEEDILEWEDGMCTATCPSCGAGLDQTYDCPELEDEEAG